ncbi:MAG: hypothetical protein P4L34_07530 [Paludibacter sp.]|nr:hypothetical protein [Paludibacter sp.]
MKTKLFTLLITVMALCFVSTNLSAQAIGDYGSSGTMNWNGGTWNVCVTAGTWTGATTTTTAPTKTTNVWILAGHTVTCATTAGLCNDLHVAGTLTNTASNTDIYHNIDVTGIFTFTGNLISGDYNTTGSTITIASGGSMTSGTGVRLFVRGTNGTNTIITNNGTFGASTAAVNAGPKITLGGISYAENGSVNLTFTGSGTTILNSILADWYSENCSITINQNLTLTPNTGAAAVQFPGNAGGVTSSSIRTFTINAGSTVTVYSPSAAWFASTAQTTVINPTTVYNINGTLDLTGASLYLGCTTNTTIGATGSTNSTTINVGANAILKCGNVVKIEKPQSGQNLACIVAAGGTIMYPGTSYQTLSAATLSGTYAITAAPYALLANTNSNLSFTGASATTLTLNSDLSVGNNLTLSAATSLSGAANLIVNGILSLTGKLTNNTGSITLGSSAVISGSSTNYIDLINGGSLSRKSVPTSATLFPIGAGSYTPLTLINTSGTPDITTKVKTSSDNAIQDATKIVNLQWSVSSSATTTADITYQFNGVNKAATFDPTTTCDLGNYTSAWTSVNVNIPTGLDPYTVSATGLTIPTTNNLYVIGNTGAVVRLAPTTTTWSGAVDTDWTNAGNWSNGVPDNTLEAIIPSSLTNYPVISVSQNIKNLTIASGASVTNNGTLNIYGPSVSNNGTLSGSGVYAFVGSVAQTITGSFSVNHLTLNNNSGVVNNGVLTVNADLTVIAGGITGTAPVYSTDLSITFTGSGTSASGLILSPSSGNVGTLTVGGSGTLSLSSVGTVKNLVLTSGFVDNSSYNITVSASLSRASGALTAAPIYSGSIPVTYNGLSSANSGYEIAPASGSISVFTVNTTNTYTIISSLTTSGDINVVAGILQMATNVTVGNITVANGATFNSDNTATTTARRTLTVGNGAAGNDAVLTVNGTLGNGTKWSNDGIDIEISPNAKTFSVNGIGIIGISGLRPANNSDSRTLDIAINQNIYLDRDNGGAASIEPALTLQNGTGTYARTLTIASGVTVAFRGNAGFHGMKNYTSSTDELISNYASSASNQGNYTYFIDGTLDLSYYNGSLFNLNTCSYSGSIQSVLVNVKKNGTLKLGNIVKIYNALLGQTCGIVADSASTVVFNYNGNQTNLLSGGGTIPVFSFYNLNINNSNGVSFTSSPIVKGALTQTSGNITGSSVVMGGTVQQTIVSNGNNIENLTINNAAGVLGAPMVTNTLYLTNGVLQDFSNLSNATLVFNGTSSQTIGAGLTAVKNVTINNPNGVSLGSDPTISGVLNILSGKLYLGDHNLTFGSTGSISMATSNNYLVTNGTGLVIMNAPASTSTVFPVGTSATFNPLTLNPASAATFYVGVKDSNSPALPISDATILPLNSINRTWNITTSTPSATTLTFGYNGTTDSNSGFDNSGTNVALLQYNGSTWGYVGSGSVTPGIGVTTAKTGTIEGIGSFSSYTIANPGPGAVYTNTSGSTFSDIFRSKANGNWNSSTVWELYDASSSTWTSTVLTPSETSTVDILSGDTITITTQAGVGNLTIESGAALKSSVSAYTSTPIVLTIGKASSIIRNNGLFGCPIGSVAGTAGDGIALALDANCVSFSLAGTGESGIGSLYAVAGSNNLSAVISQDVQFRRTTASGKQTALTLVDPTATAFNGSRNLLITAGNTVSFLNANSCLHGTAFSSAGSYSEQQGNITYDIQGKLDLKGGNVYITSSTNASSSTQIVKLNIGKQGSLIAGGDFNICKVQATQAVYVNMEDSAKLDCSAASTANTSFYGPSTNSTSGYGSNYVWIITNGTAAYSRVCGTGTLTKIFNVAIAPFDGNYITMAGNPVAVSTGTSTTDVYSVGVNPGQPYPFTSFSANYAINRTWSIVPGLPIPLGTYLKFGFTGGSVDANSSYSPTFPTVVAVPDSYEVYASTAIPAGATDLFTYESLTSKWIDMSTINNVVPITGTIGTAWQINFNMLGTLISPYVFTFKNAGSPTICN